ncbi:MAG: methionine--tRNA ligase, partial [Deltaproteobacteria bacterium]|nr:methionine--tRNA ligase [Deltaproteobacteria bacterium]
MSQPFYITTPIYYVNDAPHLGHAYTTIVADAIARFHRMRGDATFMLTGTDEHGQKIEEAAKKRGLSPQELCDQVAPRFQEMWKTLGISNDDFIRTTEPRHKAIVLELWKRISANGDLYLTTYQGWYCVGCEAFYKESDLIKDGDTFACATHKKPVDWIDKERSWFFALSKYAEPLLEHIEKNPGFIQPEQYRTEIKAFIKGGLRDLSVSRTSFAWGIQPPEPDPEGMQHVIYVWLDALTNYLSALCEPGQLGGPRVDQLWPSAIHLIGKDILRFHAVYWPAFLLSAGLPLPRTILAHGWWTVRGEKISKSMPATRIDPVKLSEALGESSAFGLPIGIDAMRYYLMREVPLGNDGDFTFESLFGRYNAELANDLGNLINRSLTMITRYAVDVQPRRDDAFHFDNTENPHWQLEVHARETVRSVAAHLDACMPSRALEQVWRFVRIANGYIGQTEPWAMAKVKNPALAHTLWSLQASLWLIARLVAPVLPATSQLLRGWLGDSPETPPTWP